MLQGVSCQSSLEVLSLITRDNFNGQIDHCIVVKQKISALAGPGWEGSPKKRITLSIVFDGHRVLRVFDHNNMRKILLRAQTSNSHELIFWGAGFQWIKSTELNRI